jgi:hypothetical protein
MKKVRFAHEYYHLVVGAIDKSGIFADRASLGKTAVFEVDGKQHIEILASLRGARIDLTARLYDSNVGLVLLNGTLLGIRELVEVTRGGTVTRLRYSYHYQDPRDGYYFRFEKDLTPDPNPIWKPQVHFHTSGRPKIHKSYAVASTAFPPPPAPPARGGEFPPPSQQQKKPDFGGKSRR